VTPASKLQDHLKHLVQASGGQYRKTRWEGRRGCPDCFVWWPTGAHAWVEIKAGNDRYSTLQKREVARMRDSGLPVYEVRTLEDVEIVAEAARKGLRVPKTYCS